jgi:multimeric flavodoxin WrbA
LAIAGSPRRGGNTDLLLQKAVEGATNQSTDVVKVVLCDLFIAPCRHCDGCLPTGRCVVDDDMQKVHRLLRETDRLILASPIFFMGLTAQTKAMIDRCQALWVLKYVLKMPVAYSGDSKRKALFISVGGTGLARLFEPALETVKVFLRVLDFSLDNQITFSRIDQKGDILKHPTALQDAFEAGRKLVEII